MIGDLTIVQEKALHQGNNFYAFLPPASAHACITAVGGACMRMILLTKSQRVI